MSNENKFIEAGDPRLALPGTINRRVLVFVIALCLTSSLGGALYWNHEVQSKGLIRLLAKNMEIGAMKNQLLREIEYMNINGSKFSLISKEFGSEATHRLSWLSAFESLSELPGILQRRHHVGERKVVAELNPVRKKRDSVRTDVNEQASSRKNSVMVFENDLALQLLLDDEKQIFRIIGKLATLRAAAVDLDHCSLIDVSNPKSQVPNKEALSLMSPRVLEMSCSLTLYEVAVR